jgi:siroheme synthase-like protein
MGLLAAFLEISGRRCIVVGGGEIGRRKIDSALEAGARVTLISPAATPYLQDLARAGKIAWISRAFAPGDLCGAAIVFAAIGDREAETQIAREAREAGIPVNVADVPELCTFHSPAVVRRGAIQVAIGTGGESPALAARIRREIEALIGPEYALAAEIHRAARRWIRTRIDSLDERAHTMKALAEADLPSIIRREDYAELNAKIRSIIGTDLATLGFAHATLQSRAPQDITR